MQKYINKMGRNYTYFNHLHQYMHKCNRKYTYYNPLHQYINDNMFVFCRKVLLTIFIQFLSALTLNKDSFRTPMSK